MPIPADLETRERTVVTTLEESPADAAAWDAFVLGHPQGTFFHRTGWQRVLTRALPYRPVSLMARRDGRIVGVLPLSRVPTLPVGESLVSIPLAAYGGIVAEDAEAERLLLHRATEIAEAERAQFLELRNRTAVPDLEVKDLYVTFRRPIHKDEESNLAAIPRKQRRMVRQGEKHGLTAVMGGRELVDPFYRIYSHSVRNLGSPVYSRRLFSALLDEFGDDCRILGVMRDGAMVAGVMTFLFRDEVIPYYGGALRDAFRFAANDFMYWSLLCWGAEHGYGVFDFGRSKKGTGPFDFKRHWGFEPVDLPYQYHLVRRKTMPDLSPKNPSYSVPIRMWKHLPLWITERLGPKLVVYFP